MRRLAFLALLVVTPEASASAKRLPDGAALTAGAPPAEIVEVFDAGMRIVDAAEPAVRRTRKKVHLKKGELTLAVARHAARYHGKKMGSETVRVIDGRRYAFCVEEHYHSPESGLTPVGTHKGVTVYGFEE